MEFIQQCKNLINPFYLKKRNLAIEVLLQSFSKNEILIHEPEGAYFLWIVFPSLKIDTSELYKILKKNKLIIVPGNYYYPNLTEEEKRSSNFNGNKSIRLSYSQSDEQIIKGIEILKERIKQYL